jgi:hypothetical protein
MDTRGFAESSQASHTRPATADKPVVISLPGTQALLVHQLFNEILNGIHGIQFETQIGMSEAALQRIFDEFDAWVDAREYDARGVIVVRDASGRPIGKFERSYSVDEIRALRNMAEVVMLDLGQEEFFTRTGFSLAEAKQLLDRFNAALLDRLHLDRASKSVAH